MYAIIHYNKSETLLFIQTISFVVIPMKKRTLFSIFLLCLLLCILPSGCFSNVSAASAKTSNTGYKNTFRTIKGKIYYYNSKGKKLKSTWKTIEGKRYYFCSDGHAATGFKTISK